MISSGLSIGHSIISPGSMNAKTRLLSIASPLESKELERNQDALGCIAHFNYNWPMPWFLYIAQARTGRYYVGITTEPERRIRDHNNGKGSRMAKGQGPFTLVYTSGPLSNQSAARKLEMQVKKWKRDKKESLIKGEIE